MSCSGCGIQINENDNFCPRCGTANQSKDQIEQEEIFDPTQRSALSTLVFVVSILSIIISIIAVIEEIMFIGMIVGSISLIGGIIIHVNQRIKDTRNLFTIAFSVAGILINLSWYVFITEILPNM